MVVWCVNVMYEVGKVAYATSPLPMLARAFVDEYSVMVPDDMVIPVRLMSSSVLDAAGVLSILTTELDAEYADMLMLAVLIL